MNENKEVIAILLFSDLALEGAICKGNDHWCVKYRWTIRDNAIRDIWK